ncbi:MAG: hypothetical protein JWP37_3026 [Mucilaginibacter sp.]|nr:hypothetical protein [Mucilaginibacter sp.]
MTEHQLYNYIKGQLPLRELLLAENKDFIYSVEIDKDFAFNNAQALHFDDLRSEYIPEIESYYSFPVPTVYNELIKKIESNPYLQHLRESALYFKLTPSNVKFDTSVTAIDASIFLKNISDSFLSYAQFDFFEKFKSQFGDLKKTK